MQELKTNEFREKIETQPTAVVEYWAPWCGPCRAMIPKVEQISSESTVFFYKVNIDEEPELKLKAGIKAIPALVFYRDGKIVDFLFGDNPVEKIKQKLTQLME